MKSLIACLLLLLLAFAPFQTVSGQGDVAILSPQAGEGVKGRVIVSGYVKATNAVRYDLDFAYSGQESAGWQPITSAEKPGPDGSLGVWDTTVISDGNYSLRLRVYLKDGQTSDHLVEGIRVRNYSAMETSTPGPKSMEQPVQPTASPVNLLPSGSNQKPLPANPAALTTAGFQLNLILSVVTGIILSILLAVLFAKRKPPR